MKRRTFLLFTAALSYVLALTMAGVAATEITAQAPLGSATAAPQAQAGYVGSDTCLGCHDDKKNLSETIHGKTTHPRSPAAGMGCESCHGPGQKHAESGDATLIRTLSPASTPPRDVSATCTSCHNRGVHSQWSGSMHDTRNLSCATCHSIHNPKSETAQLKTTSEIETCATCHKAQVLKVQRAAHMPVREGKMTCTTCHNPHGSTNVRMLKVGNWVNESCVSCHTEKRGPFLWEHAAGRESCISCHDPHGSSNDRMLVAKLPMLCQRCHIGTRHPSTIYDNVARGTSNRLFARGCVNCHQNIHGSNHPSGHTFLR